MLNEICAELKNYFCYDEDRHIGDWQIEGGIITPSLDFQTDYFRIVGSRLNDGVHKVSDLTKNPLKDESFHGGIWIMSIPDDFLSLVAEIEAWQEKYGCLESENMSPYQSESFAGYSYSKMSNTGLNGANSNPTWQNAYSDRLKIYRKWRAL